MIVLDCHASVPSCSAREQWADVAALSTALATSARDSADLGIALGSDAQHGARPSTIADEIGATQYFLLVERARLVRAFNLVGGGLRVAERYDAALRERVVDVESLSTSEIGGRVPTSSASEPPRAAPAPSRSARRPIAPAARTCC